MAMMESDPQFVGLMFFIASVVVIALVAIIGGFLHSRRERLMTHAERMKALELGRDLPEDACTSRLKSARGGATNQNESEESLLARKCFSTALWIALIGFPSTIQVGSQGVAIVVAIAAGAACMTATICGTVLASRELSNARERRDEAGPNLKPMADPDAYDVVARRG
jgi:hypothetical protein